MIPDYIDIFDYLMDQSDNDYCNAIDSIDYDN